MGSSLPVWATADRQRELVELFQRYGNRCLLGHRACPDASHYVYLQPHTVYVNKPVHIPITDGSGIKVVDGVVQTLTYYRTLKGTDYKPEMKRMYDVVEQNTIEGWRAEDRAKRDADWKAERAAMHRNANRSYPVGGQFDAIAKDEFFATQPLYYRVGMGFSAVTLRPFAKVKLPSGVVELHVDIGDALKPVSKNARRKAIRYGRGLPLDVQSRIDHLCAEAVKRYLAR
jgi:hypothetical protein